MKIHIWQTRLLFYQMIHYVSTMSGSGAKYFNRSGNAICWEGGKIDVIAGKAIIRAIMRSAE